MRRFYTTISLTIAVLLVMTLLILGPVTPAFGWGQATHAYIAEEVNQIPWNYYNLQNMYGGMAPDLHMMFPVELREGVYNATHKEYDEVSGAAKTFSEKAFAAGWVTHGPADVLAGSHKQPGYETPWINALVGFISGHPLELGIPEDKAPAVADLYVEAGGDLVLAEEEENVPQKVSRAAALRSFTIPFLLKRAYPEINGLLAAESTFRLYLIAYGEALSSGVDPIARGVQLLVWQEDGVFLTLDQSRTLLGKAMEIVGPEYMTAVVATIDDLKVPAAPPRPLASSRSKAAVTWGQIKAER